MSLSEWRYFIERNPLLDFVPTSADYLYLVLTPQPPKVDLDLFIRPFTDDAWVSIGAMVGVLLGTTIIPYILFPNFFEETNGFRVVQIVTMLFFVLINAFYGGAMTMFFTSEIKVPFEGIRDVMRDDSWVLIVQHGRMPTSVNCLKFDILPNAACRQSGKLPVSKRCWRSRLPEVVGQNRKPARGDHLH